MEDFLERVYLGNTVREYLIALAIFLVGVLAVRVMKSLLIRKLQSWAANSKNRYDDLLVHTVSRFGVPALNLLVLYWALYSLEFSPRIHRVLDVAVASVVAFFLIRLVTSTLRYLVEDYVRRQEHGPEKVQQVQGIILILSVVVWALGLIFLFSNLGYDVTAIIAGLGVGGIAVALAAQNILGDLFNYFVIFFDKPFEVGDFIIVDDKLGTVEYIGIKTTRVKSLSGEQIVFSNSDLTNSRIHNYKRMFRRRVVFNVKVGVHTPPEHVKTIPQILRQIIQDMEGPTLDRAHLLNFDREGMNYEVVYYVESPDYNVYMDIQQAINFAILDAFRERNIELLYPSLFVKVSSL
jgi:small-conductance mechanosensitive channel